MVFFQCFSCSKVSPMEERELDKCPSCGSMRGEVIDKDRVARGLENGAFYNIDPKTGKPKYKK